MSRDSFLKGSSKAKGVAVAFLTAMVGGCSAIAIGPPVAQTADHRPDSLSIGPPTGPGATTPPRPTRPTVVHYRRYPTEIDVYFSFGSTKLDAKSLASLEQFWIKGPSKLEIEAIIIVAHTDSVGSESSNKRLSILRAKSVARWYVERGVPQSKLHLEGYGVRRHVANNSTSNGRALNRRAEIAVIGRPIGKLQEK